MSNASWNDVDYHRTEFSSPSTLALVSRLENAYANGRVILHRYVPIDAQLFDEAAHRDLQGTDHLLSTFLQSRGVQDSLSDLDLVSCTPFPPPYHATGAFEWEGALTHLLISGGAYGGGVPEQAARDLSRSFVDACVDDHHLMVTVFALHGAWSTWFFDVAWDSSYIVYDRSARAWTCLFCTDTD